MVYWLKTKPLDIVAVVRLSAVRLMLSLLGEMVVLRKYPALLPQIISMFPLTYPLLINKLPLINRASWLPLT